MDDDPPRGPDAPGATGRPNKDRIVDEHWWFTATMLGFNGLAISASDTLSLGALGLGWMGVLNGYCVYLIVHRAAAHADRFDPQPPTPPRPARLRASDRASATAGEVRAALRHAPYVVAECSGALFYIALVLTSYVALVVTS